MNKEDKIIEQEFKIPIEELFPKFDDHLKVKNNYRILFSGKFGIGKTYFLNEFFESKKNEYEVFHLFPVNYQITSNEDIIEFLKYDILVELFKKDKDIFQKDDYSSMINLQRLAYLWGKDNFTEIFKTGISFIPKLGKSLKDTISLTENFLEFKSKIEAGEKGFVDKFLKEIKKKNISETDSLSELLKQKVKKQKDEKQSVLVLDDLERIDPEHIFRILNIFSAHFDLHNDKLVNKFGFDKIVLVTDYQNIKSIFHHKYGKNTDSNGYFNKFFSFEIFQFQNEEIVAKAVDQIISKFEIEDENLKEALGEQGYLRLFLEDILTKSLELSGKEKLDLRQLLKGINFSLSAFKKGSYNNRPIYRAEAPILQFINLGIKALISIFDGLDNNFLSVLKKIRSGLRSRKENDGVYKSFSEHLLQKIFPFDTNVENLQKGWSDYSIKFNKGEITGINIKRGDVISPDFLFFDLLIEYVEKKDYLQEEGAYI